MPTPMVTSEPWGRLQGLADVYTQANAQNTARLGTVQKARENDLDFAAKIMTSAPALSAFGGMSIADLATNQGNLAENSLAGTYAQQMDKLRLASAVPGAGRGGSGSGSGHKGPKDDQFYVTVGGVPTWMDSAAFTRMKEAQTLYGGPDVQLVTPPTSTVPGPGVTVGVPGVTGNDDGTYTLSDGSVVDANGNPA